MQITGLNSLSALTPVVLGGGISPTSGIQTFAPKPAATWKGVKQRFEPKHNTPRNPVNQRQENQLFILLKVPQIPGCLLRAHPLPLLLLSLQRVAVESSRLIQSLRQRPRAGLRGRGMADARNRASPLSSSWGSSFFPEDNHT